MVSPSFKLDLFLPIYKKPIVSEEAVDIHMLHHLSEENIGPSLLEANV